MTTSEQAALLAVRPSLANRSRGFNARSFAIVVSHPRLTCISDNYSNFSYFEHYRHSNQGFSVFTEKS